MVGGGELVDLQVLDHPAGGAFPRVVCEELHAGEVAVEPLGPALLAEVEKKLWGVLVHIDFVSRVRGKGDLETGCLYGLLEGWFTGD